MEFTDLVAGTGIIWVMVLLTIWTVPWKGYALWKAARRGDTAWFIVLLVVNTAAILELIYIFGFSRKAKQSSLVRDESGDGVGR